MTIDEVMSIVKEHTGQDVTPETKLDDLGMDSLDFLDLMIKLSIPDECVKLVNTVNDLYCIDQIHDEYVANYGQ